MAITNLNARPALEFLAIVTLLLVIPPWSDAQLTAEIPYLESTIGITSVWDNAGGWQALCLTILIKATV